MNLLTLPTELIKYLAIYLDVEDKSSFRLLNKRIYLILESIRNQFIHGQKNILIEAFPINYTSRNDKYAAFCVADAFCR